MSPTRANDAHLEALRHYIQEGWRTLARSNAQMAEAAVDPKFATSNITRWKVYVSLQENLERVEQELRGQMKPGDFAQIEICRLPQSLAGALQEPGLLYLPHPYVVPGGRFNEMYGWDSYFIQVGLLRDGQTVLAKNMIDNHLYQIENYGAVLNANRSYFLSRSHPPFLTQMILGVHRQTNDTAWLKSTVPMIESYYRFWTKDPHLTAETGLSRYYDSGIGPAPEVIADERDAEGRTHYDRVCEYYRTHEIGDYDIAQYYDRAHDELTPLFYVGDRSMRESGFDPSNRFGPFSVDIVHYDPVCLNSLLYLMETDTAEILSLLGSPSLARVWTTRAHERRQTINRLMWDEKDGLYYDYNFVEKKARRYPFISAFYPLWVGVADDRHAARMVANLHLFERPGGLLTSTQVTGSQWDAPFGWAPTEMIAIQGLRRYGYNEEANRITANFLSLILKEFIKHKTIVEKYDVERRESEVAGSIKFGYDYNVIGFGWTNAAFVELYGQLPQKEQQSVLKLDGIKLPKDK